jgi:hypothetical protein
MAASRRDEQPQQPFRSAAVVVVADQTRGKACASARIWSDLVEARPVGGLRLSLFSESCVHATSTASPIDMARPIAHAASAAGSPSTGRATASHRSTVTRSGKAPGWPILSRAAWVRPVHAALRHGSAWSVCRPGGAGTALRKQLHTRGNAVDCAVALPPRDRVSSADLARCFESMFARVAEIGATSHYHWHGKGCRPCLT